MSARVRIGKRGKEQPAIVTGVLGNRANWVGVDLYVTNGSLPDVRVFLAPDDPNTAILARKLAAALDAAGVDWRTETRPGRMPPQVYECGRGDCPGTTDTSHLQSACPGRGQG